MSNYIYIVKRNDKRNEDQEYGYIRMIRVFVNAFFEFDLQNDKQKYSGTVNIKFFQAVDGAQNNEHMTIADYGVIV